VDALRRLHEGLAASGILLDLHPTAPGAYAVAGGRTLGAFDDRDFLALVRSTEQGLEEAVALGLFEPERELKLVVVDRFESADELLDRAYGRRLARVPRLLASEMRAAAEAPFEIRHPVVLRRLRALRAA